MSATRWAAALVNVIVLTGCSGHASHAAGPPSPTPASHTLAQGSPTPAIAPKPNSGTLTREQAAKRYLELVAPINAADDLTQKRCRKDMDYLTSGGESAKTEPEILANVRQCYTQELAANRAFLTGVQSTRWSADVQPDVDKMLDYQGALIYAMSRLTHVRTSDEFRQIEDAWPPDNGAPDLVRARLGLPERPAQP